MFCPLTGKPCGQPKKIHVTDVANGVPSHLFICEQCLPNLNILGVVVEPPTNATFGQAAQSGWLAKPSGPLAFFMKLIDGLDQQQKEKEALQMACPTCGLTLHEFTKTGKMGCPACYEHFHEILAPIIGAAHEGASHHAGKHPKANKKPKYDPVKTILSSLEVLQKKMDLAVQEERYEDAAKIRDQMKMLRAKIDGN